MKILVFILSYILFSQSLSVCSPTIVKNRNFEELSLCSVDKLELSEKDHHKCCASNKKNNSDEDKDKGCCGDNCQCFCCAHIVISYIHYYQVLWESPAQFKEKNISNITVHSFDFHPSISYPPQYYI